MGILLTCSPRVSKWRTFKWRKKKRLAARWTWVDVLTATGVESYNIETSGARGHRTLIIWDCFLMLFSR